jgi:NAD(P)-dependent dehydrogenase (short-subunit alcohol dehydrogenase family)
MTSTSRPTDEQRPTTPVVPIRFDDKVVIVTGASRGIGRVLALGFAAAGAHTVFCARRQAELRSVEDEITAAGGSGLAVAADLSQPDEVARTVSTTLDRFGRVDVLINNLGVAGPTAPVEDTSLEDWQQTFDVNLTSAFLAIRATVPGMKREGSGVIVNVGSVLGKVPYPYRVCYAVTKMGMIGMTRVLATELALAGIRVNTILPGSVTGERGDEIMAAQAERRGITREEVKAELEAASPMNTQVSPESILNMALYLASDHAKHMTGQDINVTAGFVMH